MTSSKVLSPSLVIVPGKGQVFLNFLSCYFKRPKKNDSRNLNLNLRNSNNLIEPMAKSKFGEKTFELINCFVIKRSIVNQSLELKLELWRTKTCSKEKQFFLEHRIFKIRDFVEILPELNSQTSNWKIIKGSEVDKEQSRITKIEKTKKSIQKILVILSAKF
ncbi:hypothetical protein BpHYR1_049230 [Brachionus plicatilis]|uniref:Uncharacterized protein n=1 Tax=Brachionus plicatilis TaxID=10195 RepID=A0A3M7RWX5_BRAPC|nr:hypothetical protein BpHYR1_049230 [Brachionus plicatilis]